MKRTCGRFLWSEQASWCPFFNFVAVCTQCAFFGMSASFLVCLCVCGVELFQRVDTGSACFAESRVELFQPFFFFL